MIFPSAMLAASSACSLAGSMPVGSDQGLFGTQSWCVLLTTEPVRAPRTRSIPIGLTVRNRLIGHGWTMISYQVS